MLARLLTRRTLSATRPVAARARTQRTAAQAQPLKATKTTELTFSFAPFEEVPCCVWPVCCDNDRTLMQVKAPFSAVEKQISEAANLARDAGFSSELEGAVNAQINVELTLRHVTQALP